MTNPFDHKLLDHCKVTFLIANFLQARFLHLTMQNKWFLEFIPSILNYSGIQPNTPRNGLPCLDSSPNLDSLDYLFVTYISTIWDNRQNCWEGCLFLPLFSFFSPPLAHLNKTKVFVRVTIHLLSKNNLGMMFCKLSWIQAFPRMNRHERGS